MRLIFIRNRPNKIIQTLGEQTINRRNLIRMIEFSDRIDD